MAVRKSIVLGGLAALALAAGSASAEVIVYDNRGPTPGNPGADAPFDWSYWGEPADQLHLDVTQPVSAQYVLTAESAPHALSYEPVWSCCSDMYAYGYFTKGDNWSPPLGLYARVAWSGTTIEDVDLRGDPYVNYPVALFSLGDTIGPSADFSISSPSHAYDPGSGWVVRQIAGSGIVGVRLYLATGTHYGFIAFGDEGYVQSPEFWGWETTPETPLVLPDELVGTVFNECDADLTTQGAGIGDPGFGEPDGQVTGADINFFVNAWVAGDAAIADVTTQGAGAGDAGFGVPDGLVTGSDINYYVNLWLAGCP